MHAALIVLGLSPARAQVPTTMPLQCFLTNVAGAPFTGPTDVTVSFYSVDVAGTALHTETQSVEVRDGYFTLYVGDSTPLDATLSRDQRTLFVGLQLPGEAEMTPRFQHGTVPYAAPTLTRTERSRDLLRLLVRLRHRRRLPSQVRLLPGTRKPGADHSPIPWPWT
jgi:hypothetical protein